MIPTATFETVLVVDDNVPLCELIEVLLCSIGYNVLTAHHGEDALWLARNAPRVDLLLTDLEMPGMGGEELATQFALLHPTVPILFVSSAAGPIRATPPFEFLPKPFTVAALRGAVQHALRTPRLGAEASKAA